MKMSDLTWSELERLLFHGSHKNYERNRLPGSCLMEWIDYCLHDYDEIDHIIIDHEVIGA